MEVNLYILSIISQSEERQLLCFLKKHQIIRFFECSPILIKVIDRERRWAIFIELSLSLVLAIQLKTLNTFYSPDNIRFR